MTQRPVFLNAPPIRYLAAIDSLGLLEQLYGTVFLPPSVVQELQSPQGAAPPVPVLEYDWIKLAVPRAEGAEEPGKILGPGTLEAFALARGEPDALLVLEGRPEREAARARRLEATGVLGVLLRAHQDGLIPSVKALLPGLEEAGLPMSRKLTGGVLLLSGEI